MARDDIGRHSDGSEDQRGQGYGNRHGWAGARGHRWCGYARHHCENYTIMNPLSLIPVKAYLIGAAVVALIVGIVLFAHHERSVQSAKDTAADASIALKAEEHNVKVEGVAQSESTSIGLVYEKSVAIPAVGDVGLVCSNAPRSRAVSQTPDYRPENPSATHDPGTNTFNPSLALDAIGIDADAQINALIDEVNTLRKEMEGNGR